jgi:hypothetical protein
MRGQVYIWLVRILFLGWRVRTTTRSFRPPILRQIGTGFKTRGTKNLISLVLIPS